MTGKGLKSVVKFGLRKKAAQSFYGESWTTMNIF